MTSVNDLLQDEAIRHAVSLQKYSNAVVAKIIAVLNRSDVRIFAELTERLERMDPNSFSIERLESMLTSARNLNAQAYGLVERELTSELREFAVYEVSYQAQMLTAHVPVGVHVAALNAEQVYAAAVSRPFQGTLLREVWKDLDAKKMKLVRQNIAQGFLESKTTDQIIRELRGTRAKGYADGLLDASRRDAEAITRTALGHMAGFVQDRTADANQDIIKACVWSSTIDLRVSKMCLIRDNKQYHPVTHKPIGHDIPWGQGPGRLHWRCRSAQTYLLKSYKELGLENVPEVVVVGGTRASLDGQIPKETTLPEWAKKQSAARQDELFGPTRGQLLRSGGLDVKDLYNSKGRYLSIDELRERDQKVFAKAGL